MEKINLNNKNLKLGVFIIGLLSIMCIMSFFWTPYHPNQTSKDPSNQLAGPSKKHLLGTDHLGRDNLSRIMKGSQTTFYIAITTLMLASLIGVSLGLLSGYVGGWIDEFIMRFVDVFIAIPGTVLILLFVTIFGRGTNQTVVAISIMNFPTFARITRNQVLYLKNQDHIQWAKSLGASDFRIIFLHILPDLFPILLVASAMKFSSSIMAEAGLSYLGLGVQPPNPSWGNMLTRAQASIITNPFTAIVPGLMITLFVIGFNLLADGLRQALNIREVM